MCIAGASESRVPQRQEVSVELCVVKGVEELGAKLECGTFLCEEGDIREVFEYRDVPLVSTSSPHHISRRVSEARGTRRGADWGNRGESGSIEKGLRRFRSGVGIPDQVSTDAAPDPCRVTRE